MSRPKITFDLPADTLRIVRWDDPVLDAVGHDPRSAYVERFWLSLLGPSTTFLIRRIVAGLEGSPDGYDLHLEDTARSIGLGLRGGLSGPFYRALVRTGQFSISRPAGPGELAVRTRLQTLTRHQVERLPSGLREEHAAWEASTRATPDAAQRRVRARRLALSLLELGEPVQGTELQLQRWNVEPALASEALQWAQARRSEAPLSTAAAAPAAPPRSAPPTPPTPAAPIPPPPHRRARPVFDPADDAA